MSQLDPPPEAVHEVVSRALAEDLHEDGDVTTLAVVPPEARGRGTFVARAAGVLAGTAAASDVFRQVDPGLACDWLGADGDRLRVGDAFATVEGRVRSILAAERTVLNLLTHCSGVATVTRCFVDAAAGGAGIRDTRKTLPGLRALEKAAVRAGGGQNHRSSLSESVLIKDNHLAFTALPEAVRRAREAWPGRTIEVECDTLDQVAEARQLAPDLVLVDNMTPAEVTEAVRILDGKIPVEVSGGVTLDTVSAYAAAGVQYVSVGAITHSAPSLDLALDVVTDPEDT